MNKLVVIGLLGCRTCYLNISREEAIERWLKENALPDEESQNYMRKELLRGDDIYEVKEIEFTDEFETYAVWGK